MKLFTMLNVVFLAEKDGFCSSLAPKKQFLINGLNEASACIQTSGLSISHSSCCYTSGSNFPLLDRYYVKRNAVFNK